MILKKCSSLWMFVLALMVMVFLQVGCATNVKKTQREWMHLELGAGNYGADGHTKTSQQKTVLMALTYVSKNHNYIDDLPILDVKTYKPEEQYQVLFWTLDQLIKRYGEQGVFHVNDLIKEYADFASEKLRIYAKSKGYQGIRVESIPGDYTHIQSTVTLAKYNRSLYDSVHLKNPEVSFYYHGMDGDKMITDRVTRIKARALLQDLANLSHEGLYFFPVDYKDYFIPDDEKIEFINKGIFYQSTQIWEPVPYVFPTGESFPKHAAKVYFIQSQFKGLSK